MLNKLRLNLGLRRKGPRTGLSLSDSWRTSAIFKMCSMLVFVLILCVTCGMVQTLIVFCSSRFAVFVSLLFGEDCHGRAWNTVSTFLSEHICIFSGRSLDAESTVMPNARAWIKNMVSDMACSSDDFSVVLVVNTPSMGILSASRTSFLLSFVTNVVADWPNNCIVFLVHPNRAGQETRTVFVTLPYSNYALLVAKN